MSNAIDPRGWVKNFGIAAAILFEGIATIARPKINLTGTGAPTVSDDPVNQIQTWDFSPAGGSFGPVADPVVSFAADVATAGATPTAFATGNMPYTLPDKTLVDVVVTIVGKKAASAESFVQDYRARYVRNGGSAALIGSVIPGANPIGTGALAGASATILLSGNTIAPQVTGIAATSISWKATMQVTPVLTGT